jgi:SOS response regulatory protein OraA/RecX
LSEYQVRQRLARRAIDSSSIDDAIARLTREGALDDRRVAGAFVRTAIRLKLRGPARLRSELRALGIDRAHAEEALAGVLAETAEPALLRQALRRRWPRDEAPSPAQAARLYRALIRQGFTHANVRAALRGIGASDVDES